MICTVLQSDRRPCGKPMMTFSPRGKTYDAGMLHVCEHCDRGNEMIYHVSRETRPPEGGEGANV